MLFQSIIPAPVAVLNLFTSAAVIAMSLYILRLFIVKKEIPTIKYQIPILINHQIFIEDIVEFGILSLEFKMFLFSSVAGAAVSAAGAAVSVATASAVAGLQFQLHLFLYQNLYQKVLRQQLLLKIKFYRLI
jgi:hypothetical protein